MKLVNGFKLMYEKGVGDERRVYASKETTPVAMDDVTVPNIGSYPNAKLFYEKNNQLYVSNSNTPTDADVAFTVTSDDTTVIGIADDPVAPPAPAAVQQDEAPAPVPKKTTKKKTTVETEEETGEKTE